MLTSPFREGQACPRCAFPFHALLSEEPPPENAVTVCPGCGAVVALDAGLTPRELSADEWQSLEEDERATIEAVRLSLFQERVKLMRRARAAAVLN